MVILSIIISPFLFALIQYIYLKQANKKLIQKFDATILGMNTTSEVDIKKYTRQQ